jgi:hypothetical protein
MTYVAKPPDGTPFKLALRIHKADQLTGNANELWSEVIQPFIEPQLDPPGGKRPLRESVEELYADDDTVDMKQ